MASTACWASETVSQLEATVRVPALVFGLTGGGWTLLPSVVWYGLVASVAWERYGHLFLSVACGGYGNGFWFIGCLWHGYGLVRLWLGKPREPGYGYHIAHHDMVHIERQLMAVRRRRQDGWNPMVNCLLLGYHAWLLTLWYWRSMMCISTSWLKAVHVVNMRTQCWYCTAEWGQSGVGCPMVQPWFMVWLYGVRIGSLG